MIWNAKKLCFTEDDGRKLQPTRSLVERFGNCCEFQTQSRKNRWQAWLVKELYGLSPRPRQSKEHAPCICGAYDHENGSCLNEEGKENE
jgi:hypothetical protein